MLSTPTGGLDGVEPDTLGHHVAALFAPDVERRLKPDLVAAVLLSLLPLF